ncbi:unnamed protein product [Paramecium sonneborni]|uniref:Protein kinase domain-containing protein n=1 Tax=Paramecium sonneborni TaxID=65129 RepID=A0A8S1LMJ3_9CILI|nr:unnamed protein product [Paramecium sonneborni]
MADEWSTKQVLKYIVINEKLSFEAFGCLYKGFFKEDETKLIAVKMVKIALFDENPKLLELFKQEIAILQKINHPNIIRILDVLRTNTYVYLILEYCADGNLKKYIARKKDNRLSEVEALLFIKHIVEGFKILYQNKILHRNIKPDNILLHQGIAKITDFSVACIMDSDMNAPSYLTKMGTPLYMAPQILKGQPFSSKSDIWSLGITFYELLYGRVPWQAKDFDSFSQNVLNEPISFPIKPVRSNGAKELITKMLQIEEKDRISWEELFENQIFRDNHQINQINYNLQELDDFSKQIFINLQYLDQHLVVRQIIQIHFDSFQKQQEITSKTFGEVKSKSINYGQDFNTENFLLNQQKQNKIRAAMLKYYNYFLFERNVAFFFNYVIQKTIFLKPKLNLPNLPYFRLISLIAKNQLIHLERVREQFSKEVHEKFNIETWQNFLKSEEFKQLDLLIKTDIQSSQDLFFKITIAFRKVAEEELKGQINQLDAELIKDSLNLNETTFKASEVFYNCYREIIGDNINHLLKLQSEEVDINLLILNLSICLNPYEEFKEIYFDFDIFYEVTEQLKFNEIYERLLQKRVKLLVSK